MENITPQFLLYLQPSFIMTTYKIKNDIILFQHIIFSSFWQYIR